MVTVLDISSAFRYSLLRALNFSGSPRHQMHDVRRDNPAESFLSGSVEDDFHEFATFSFGFV